MKQCFCLSCGSGPYYFATREEAEKAIDVLTGYDKRPGVRALFRIVDAEVDDDKDFNTIPALVKKVQKEDQEWADQPMFIANRF